ncbi:lasso peptide biosynthesis B2 protein [Embleya sp. AB8]|uniref:lasso peptide biosynthesis B2 protein n=1 Tax=Embleya sp. AB8 TaxID=3156304 RepID=UPI003C78580B
MSTSEALLRDDERPSPGTRLAARATVAVALAMSRLPPRHIRTILTVLRGRAGAADYRQADAARRAVVSVSVTCAGKGCLPRSIATALLCRTRGHWPVWRVGARTAPFGAHAWVEAEGLAVGEGPGISAFHPLLSVEPR